MKYIYKGFVYESVEFPATVNVDGKNRPTKNDRGSRIYPTIEGVIAFWKWFGDSNTVTNDGRPVVHFHGTARIGIDEFSGDRGFAGHFTEDVTMSDDFANSRYADSVDIGTDIEFGDAANVYPVYLKCMKTFDIYDKSHRESIKLYDDSEAYGYEDVENFAGAIKSAGYDSALDFEHGTNEVTGIAVFYPSQIKSAIGNKGSFSSSNSIATESILDSH